MGELFEKFEVNRDRRFGHRLLRTLAGSIALHALLVALVIFIPMVQSMLHIAAMFSSAEYVDEDYTLADIRERAVMIKLDPSQKLYYPPGYFSTNPTAPIAPEVPEVPDAQLIAEVRELPEAFPTPRSTPLATPTPVATPSTVSATPEVATAPNENVSTGDVSATPSEQPKTNEEVDKLAAETGVKRFPTINSKPFKDLLAKGKEMMDKGEIDLQGTIVMTIEADRNDDGTLENIVMTKVNDADEDLKNLALQFVGALSASRALAALEGAKHLTMEVESDSSSGVSAVVTTQMESEEVASRRALGYNGLLFFGKINKKGRDEEEIFKNTKVVAKGKEVTLQFTMSREMAARILAKQVSPASM